MDVFGVLLSNFKTNDVHVVGVCVCVRARARVCVCVHADMTGGQARKYDLCLA